MKTYTIAEAAELTGASPKAIRNRVDRGQLRAVKRDGVRRIPRSELSRAGLLSDDGRRPPELPAGTGGERGLPDGGGGEPGAPEAGVGKAGEPGAPELPATRPSVVGSLLERLERQAEELGELRTLTSRADTERSERDELAALIRETREAALRADARAAIVERHLSRIPSDFAAQPALPPPRGEAGSLPAGGDEATRARGRRLRPRAALAGTAGLMLLAAVVALGVVALRSVDEAATSTAGRAAGAPVPVSVLAYPKIGSPSSARVVAPGAFARQVESLDEAGFETIGASALSAVRGEVEALPRRPIVLTFDDPGSAVVADRTLARAGFRGLLVPVGPLDAADWERIRRLARTGRWDLGARAPSASEMITVSRSGAKGPFLDFRRWLFRERRRETWAEYAARVAADLDAVTEGYLSHGLRRPRVFAFPPPPQAGQRVPSELRRAIFRRFRVALVDVEPARTPLLGASRYLPRIQAPMAGSPTELVATVATTATRARRSPTSGDDRREQRRVLQGWSTAVAAGDFGSAARYFAPGAVVERRSETLLTSPQAAAAYNRSFPCRPRLEESRALGASTLAAFRLRPGGRCAEGGRVRILTVIRGGKFEEWRQLDGLPRASGARRQAQARSG